MCRCDTTPEQHLGRQFGIASMGITVGSLVGPPVAGALYKRWGFRAPFIFGIIVTGIDLLARLLLIERHEAMRWGIDPMAIAASSKEKDPEVASGVTAVERAERPSTPVSQSAAQGLSDDSVIEGEGRAEAKVEEKAREGDRTEEQPQGSKKPRVILLPHTALLKLMKSPRAAVCIIVTLIWGLEWVGQEPAIVLHLNRVWGLDPHGAGIAFIAAIVPALICESGPPIFPTLRCILTTWAAAEVLSGWLSDKYGPAPIACITILLSLPWYGLVTIEDTLAMFLTFFALEGG